jgi:hypothetical protein
MVLGTEEKLQLALALQRHQARGAGVARRRGVVGDLEKQLARGDSEGNRSRAASIFRLHPSPRRLAIAQALQP